MKTPTPTHRLRPCPARAQVSTMLFFSSLLVFISASSLTTLLIFPPRPPIIYPSPAGLTFCSSLQTPPRRIPSTELRASLMSGAVRLRPPTAPRAPAAVAVSSSVVGLRLPVTHIHHRPTPLLYPATAPARSWRRRGRMARRSTARCASTTSRSGGLGPGAAGSTPATPPLAPSLPERRTRKTRTRRAACSTSFEPGIPAGEASSPTGLPPEWRRSMKRRRGMKWRRRSI